MKYILFFSILILFILVSSWIVHKKRYWLHQPVFTYMKNKNSEILTEIDKFNTKNFKTSLHNVVYKHTFDIKSLTNENIVYFLNNYYNEDLLYTNSLLNKLITKYNFGKNILDYCYKSDSLVGTLFTKYGKISILNKKYDVAIVDYGCIIPKYQNKYIFNTLINRVIKRMGKDKIPIAIHKSDDKPLPQKHHLQYDYRIIFKKDNKELSLLKPKEIDYITDKNITKYYNKVVNIFSKYVINPILTIESFQNEFITDLPECISLVCSNPFILVNGYFQDYKIAGKIEKIFEIRYLLYEYVDNNKIKEIIKKIMKDHYVSKIVFQNIGGNMILENLFNTKYGHKTYLYIFNFNKIDLEKKDFFLHF